MKYLIVGLGNIGDEYAHTRHNIGFDVLDALAGASNTIFKADRYGDRAEVKYRGRTLILIKPSTYMNLSGKAVRYWLDKEKLSKESLLVVTDDLALPLGRIRIRAKGSDGGHNGLKSIQDLLQTSTYPRLRFGIGNDFSKGQQVNFVLGKWETEEKVQLEQMIERSCEAILAFTTIGLPRTMSEFNKAI